jgi:hypothetical protein
MKNMSQQQRTQTPEEKTQILRDYFRNDFARCFPHLEPIFNADGTKVLCKPSYIVLSQAIDGIELVRKDIISGILLYLDSNDLLVRKPQVVEKIVQVERQPTQHEKDEAAKKAKKDAFEKAHAAGLLNSSKHNRNELDDQFDQGKPQPLPLTEQERVALNARNRRIDEVIGETLSAINSYTGPSHARTYVRREQLRTTFNKFKNEVTDVDSALKLQRTIDAKISSFDSNPSVR